jgi:hypothetical protein
MDEAQRWSPAWQRYASDYLSARGNQAMEMPTTTREFWRHRVYGDIYAVELMVSEGQREVLGARKCSRPEEQTRGALPVMQLYAGGDDAEFASNNRADFGMWEPPMTRDDAIEFFRVKVNNTRTAKSDYERIRKQERAALKHYEKCQAEEHDAAVLLVDPPEAPPLIAMAEARPVDSPLTVEQLQQASDDFDRANPPTDTPELTAEDFDAAFGGDLPSNDDLPIDTDDDAPSAPTE